MLSPDESAQLRAHLATCPDCRELQQAYRRIGVTIRSMPVMHPPADLTDAIYARTIDAEPRRLVLLTNRLGYSLAAVAAVVVVFVMAGYLLFGGYQRGIQPAIVASHPEQNHQNWPTYNPIEITFNKEMDKGSVESALVIQPASENERLAVTWSGNTLQLGASQGLRSATTYVIKVTDSAEDKWGNNLKAGYTLTFSTNSTIKPDEKTPTVTPSPTMTPTPEPTRVIPTQTAVAIVPNAPTATATATPNQAPPVSPTAPAVPGNGNDQTESVPTATPSPTPDDGALDDGNYPPMPTATATAIPIAPTATPTQVPPTAAPTETPMPTATTPPPTATVSPTPDTIPVTDAFGSVYWANDSVRQRLGEATRTAYATDGSEMDFQDGSMLYRADISMVYVLVNNELSWTSYPNATADFPVAEEQSDGTWLPGGMFGALWQQHPELQSSLHNALSGSESTFTAGVQQFEHGTMLSSTSSVYIFYDDGTWEFWPNNG
jgi:hypothetical protein